MNGNFDMKNTIHHITRLLPMGRENVERRGNGLRALQTLLAALCLWTAAPVAAEQTVTISVAQNASPPETIAAAELAQHLGAIYPDVRFVVGGERGDVAIRLGTPESDPGLAAQVGLDALHGPESYVVTKAEIGGTQTGMILGADPAGVIYGVYALLERLGAGFFLSLDTAAESRPGAFNLAAWDLANHPLTPTRMVFNWHNFLTGCTAWDLEDWKSWIRQAQKSGFNTIMVHAYGNNPMFTFGFNGFEKPVGYLATTRQGRDWSVNHVNDVRHLHGGFLFDEPVFGSEAGKVPNDERVRAKQSMMRDAFRYARQRGVKVNFSLDFDVPSCNPPEMIMSLDPADRFKIRGVWHARPDTPGGHAYYKAQAEALMSTYPQIDTVSLWRRSDGHSGATWPMLRLDEMPESWQEEYQSIVAKDPEAAKLHQSVPAFGMAKVAVAWRKALDELGCREVQLAHGSWREYFVLGVDRFMPEDVSVIPLDWKIVQRNDFMSKRDMLERFGATTRANRVVPVIWAHHDDGMHFGSPLKIYKDFNHRLKTMNAGGFGIIHWMNWPFDAYFTAHARRVWSATEDESLRATCDYLAGRWFGAANLDLMRRSLEAWMTDMPAFGRETSDFFFDRPVNWYGGRDKVVNGCMDRIALLEQADLSIMTGAQRNMHAFFIGNERYVAAVFDTQARFEAAQAAFSDGRLDEARELLSNCRPEQVIEDYARNLQHLGPTRGEEGAVVTMNTRWLPHYTRLRQQLGMEPVRFNYGPTSHEPLAQSAGIWTFHFSPGKELWQTFGTRTTGAETFVIDQVESPDGVAERHASVCHDGLISAVPIRLVLSPILPQGSRGGFKRENLPAGEYELKLIMVEPTAAGPGERVMDVRIEKTTKHSSPATYSFDPQRARQMRLVCRGNSQNDWNSIHGIAVKSLDPNGPVSALGHAAGHAPHMAIDGRQETRWAHKGDSWIEFTLDPDIEFDEIQVDWHGSDRIYDVEIRISDDGLSWRTIELRRRLPDELVLVEDRVDIYSRAGGRNRALVLSHPVKLDIPGNLAVTLTPVEGEAVISAVELEKK